MLQARTKEQKNEVLKILRRESDNETASIESDDRLYIDGEITFDQMAWIVELLRGDRKRKAIRAAFKSSINQLWVDGNTIYFRRADPKKCEAFILSLAEFGYFTDELLKEYKETEKITI